MRTCWGVGGGDGSEELTQLQEKQRNSGETWVTKALRTLSQEVIEGSYALGKTLLGKHGRAGEKQWGAKGMLPMSAGHGAIT